MPIIRGLIFTSGLACLVIALLDWRFDKALVSVSPLHLALAGGATCTAVVLGKVMAKPTAALGGIVMALALVRYLLVKDASFDGGLLLAGEAGAALLLLGGLLWVVGSRKSYEDIEARSAFQGEPGSCALCGQYLGTRSQFEFPCPRCGSNRYTCDY